MNEFPVPIDVPPTAASYHSTLMLDWGTAFNVTGPGPQVKNGVLNGTGGAGSETSVTIGEPDHVPMQVALDTSVKV